MLQIYELFLIIAKEISKKCNFYNRKLFSSQFDPTIICRNDSTRANINDSKKENSPILYATS